MLKKWLKHGILYLTMGSFLYFYFNLHQWKHNTTRNYADKRIVKLLSKNRNRGGTGVHIKLPSGKTAILTNSHVCESLLKNDGIFVEYSPERLLPKRIIEISDDTDLCLVEPVEGIKGLKLASNAYNGELVSALGFPNLNPLTMVEGELVEKKPILVLDHIIDVDDPDDTCSLPKNKKDKINYWFTEVEACFTNIDAYWTTLVVRPGNSGSPVLNKWGNVVGLIFAGDQRTGWGAAIPLEQIKDFIKPY